MRLLVLSAALLGVKADDVICKTTQDCPLGVNGFCGKITGCDNEKNNFKDRICVTYDDVGEVM